MPAQLCLGTMTFGGQTAEAEAARMVALAVDAGITSFDTAGVYNDGQSESILGRALRAIPGAAHLSVSTKVGGLMGACDDGSPRLQERQIIDAVDASLRRLGRDAIDLLYVHQPDPNTPVAESLDALDTLRRAGKIRESGLSNYASWQAMDCVWTARSRGYAAPATAQQMLNVLSRRVESEFAPFCRAHGITLVAYNPLAGGLLTGKHDRNAPQPGTRFDGNRQYKERYWREPLLRGAACLEAVAAEHQLSLPALSLAWLIHHSAADAVVLGASNASQLKENLALCRNGPLPGEALRRIDAVWEILGGAAPAYQR